jgi:hypothetical protein
VAAALQCPDCLVTLSGSGSGAPASDDEDFDELGGRAAGAAGSGAGPSGGAAAQREYARGRISAPQKKVDCRCGWLILPYYDESLDELVCLECGHSWSPLRSQLRARVREVGRPWPQPCPRTPCPDPVVIVFPIALPAVPWLLGSAKGPRGLLLSCSFSILNLIITLHACLPDRERKGPSTTAI